MIKQESKNDIRLHRHARLRNKISGTSELPRLSVFRSNKHISCQIIDDSKGVTLAAASSEAMKIKGGNVETAKKVGAELAKNALAKGISKVVFDRSGYIYHGRVLALAEGAREGGLKF